MVKRSVLSIALLVPLVLAPTVILAETKARQTPPAKPSGQSTAKPATKAATSLPGRQRVVIARTNGRHGERIYSVKSATPEEDKKPAGKTFVVTRSEEPFLGFAPTGNSVVGIGLWRVPKTDSLDPNRNDPLRDTTGKTTRAAALGMQVNF